jgi:positive regulator of sigma E activity
VDQPDVQSQGWLFSMVVIYLMNLLVIAGAVTALSDRVTLADLGRTAGTATGAAYGWTLDKLVALWQHARALGRNEP